MYIWYDEDRTIKIYATKEQAKKYEKENNIKLICGGKIVSVQ